MGEQYWGDPNRASSSTPSTGGGGSGTSATSTQQLQDIEEKVDCDTKLPNGKTVGDYVRAARNDIDQSVRDANTVARSSSDPGPLTAILGAFFRTVAPNGPIDFKNIFAGKMNDQVLGNAGNFAYYAIGSDYIPDTVLDMGAGFYGEYAAHVTHVVDPSDLIGRFNSDRSASLMRAPGLGANGCKKP